jgi:uncharacterized protein YlxP (DUF503 family)
VVIDLHIAGCRSLKEKRAPLRSIKQHLRNAGCSVAEVAWHDTWQRSQLAISVVAASAGDVDAALQTALRIPDRFPEIDVVVRQRTVLALDEFDRYS